MDNISLLFLAPELALQLVLEGLWIGAIFALVAYGMALVWGVMNIINVAQGEFVILGGYVAFTLFQWGVHPLFGVPVAAVVLFVIGWGLYHTVIFRIVDKDLFISILATFGLSILFQQLMNQIFGADVQTAESGFPSSFMLEGMITISWIKVAAFGVTAVIAVILVAFMRRSRTGQAIRATAQNARAARIMGIDTDRIYATTYGINAALCGAAGALVSMIWVIQPFIGLPYTVRAFMIVIVAGLGNLPGVIVSGLGLGIAENYAGFILGAEFQIAFVFLALVVVLLWRSMLLARKRQYLK